MKYLDQYRTFILLMLLALSLRLSLIVVPGFSIDINDWFAWALRLSNFNFSQFYSKDIFTDYTPGYLYILGLLGFLRNAFDIQNNYFYLLLKTPAIISDLLIGFFVYSIVRRITTQKVSLIVLSLFLFNPAVIFNSTIWGQIDSILTLIILIAIFALQKRNLILSSISFAIAFLVKPQAVALTPLFALVLVKDFKIANIWKITLPGLLIIYILSLPFFPQQPLINLLQHIATTANEYPYTSLNAYNLWGIIGFWIPDKELWGNLSYQTWSYILLAIYWIIISFLYFRKRISIYSLATLATLVFFFLPTRVHERYLYPALVLLILSSILLKSRLLSLLTTILSLIHFLNLYYVYVYYNEIYLKLPKVLYQPILYNFLAENSKSLSLISFIIFILISVIIIKYDKLPKEN